MPSKVELTLLANMADRDIAAAIDKCVGWGFKWLDLKDSIYGKSVVALTDAEAQSVRALADRAGLGVYCLSTVLFFGDIEMGEASFCRAHLDPVKRAIQIARILGAKKIRLLGARTQKRDQIANTTDYIQREYPWVIDAYRSAVDMISEAGFDPLIENEVHGCIWSTPQEIVSFFAALDRPQARLIWDIQNFWQMGTFPTLDVYQQLRPLIGMVHVKGGAGETPGGTLKWRTALADATWPVVPILSAVIADEVSPVICLNSSHGNPKEGYDYSDIIGRDIRFLRENIAEIQ